MGCHGKMVAWVIISEWFCVVLGLMWMLQKSAIFHLWTFILDIRKSQQTFICLILCNIIYLINVAYWDEIGFNHFSWKLFRQYWIYLLELRINSSLFYWFQFVFAALQFLCLSISKTVIWVMKWIVFDKLSLSRLLRDWLSYD